MDHFKVKAAIKCQNNLKRQGKSVTMVVRWPVHIGNHDILPDRRLVLPNSGKTPTCFAAGTHMLRWRAVQGEQPVIERHDIAGQPGNGHVNVQAQ